MTGPKERLETKTQASAYDSPWSISTRVRMALWEVARCVLFRPTPKLCAPWRRTVLRAFGATIEGRPFVAASVRIKMPWHLTLEDRACLGPDTEVYNLGPCTLRARATVAQRCYLCGGTHDLLKAELPLVTGPIEIGPDAFVGAQSLILPGVVVGEAAVVGAGSVVTKDVAPRAIVAGNPAREIGVREFPSAPSQRDL